MYELYPYFTNDGTVGLFSRNDDDIYHSTYGALTESWQKFILPARLEEYLNIHNEIKILDICYGIGYNTKTALQVFVSNFLEKTKNKKKSLDNTTNIEAIDTDNISSKEEDNFHENLNKKNNQNYETPPYYNGEIYTDNTLEENLIQNQNKDNKNLLIDSVDLDKTLIKLSPFIRIKTKKDLLFKKYIAQKYYFNVDNNKFAQIQKINKIKIKLIEKKFKLKEEVLIILLEKMLENNSEIFNDKILQEILNQKKYTPFLSQFMMNFNEFYQKKEYNYNQKRNKMAFLHNIYYEYISQSYKNAKNILKNNEISLNFYPEDARNFIKHTEHKYNFIFLDAFTPVKCPALWTVQFFNALYSKLEEDGIILTYSNSAAVRNALLQNGFVVGKIYDNKLNKFVGTAAAKNENLIEYELDERDLDLINSKAGICFEDEHLNLDNNTIIKNRNDIIEKSELISSSKVLRGYKNDKVSL